MGEKLTRSTRSFLCDGHCQGQGQRQNSHWREFKDQQKKIKRKPCVDKQNCSKNNIPLREPEKKTSFRSNHKKTEDKISIILEEMGSSDYLPEDVWRKII